jgi:Zn-dependent peptidase ImmA (M78 family)/transcriptional regulator with XRE-family HTH domain
MMILAREYRVLSQEELADKVGVSQSHVAKIEAGIKSDIDDIVGDRMTQALGFPREFFEREELLLGFGSSSYFYRKKATIPALERKRIQSIVNLLRLAVKGLLPFVEVEPKRALPVWDLEDHGHSASNVAKALRSFWHLPDGPIKNLTALVESAGVVILPCDFGIKSIDATSLRIAGLPPLVFMNIAVPGDRWRFTLAHELAHLVMHREPHEKMEDEADAFAGEFLVPVEEIKPQLVRFPKLQVRDLIPLKRLWRVSIQALIFRAFEAEAITEAQKRGLFVRMSQLNMRQVEPEQIDKEPLSNLGRMLSTMTDNLNFSAEDIAKVLAWTPSDIAVLLPMLAKPPTRHLRVV